MMRIDALRGSTDGVDAWFAGRQGGRWALQSARAPVPPAQGTPTADAAEKLRELTELHERGVVTDAEFERLRADLRA